MTSNTRSPAAGVAGPDCEDFGSGISSAPVTWLYYGEEHKLEFNAGFIGAIQDAKTLCIRPQIGWYCAQYITPSRAGAC